MKCSNSILHYPSDSLNNELISTAGVQMLTTTTGVVRGVKQCEAFIKECNLKYKAVYITELTPKIEGYLQYTLLTDNRIRLFT